MARCSRSQGHCSRRTAVTWRSEMSSWPMRQSSKAAPSGTVSSGRTCAPARARSARASAGPRAPAMHTVTVPVGAPFADRRHVVDADLAGRRQAVSRDDEVGQVGRQVAGDEHGAAAASARSEAAGARSATAPMYSRRMLMCGDGPTRRAAPGLLASMRRDGDGARRRRSACRGCSPPRR